MATFEEHLPTPEERLLESYNAVHVPAPMKSPELDADPIINEASHNFFDEMILALRLGESAGRLLKIDHEMIVPIDGRLRFTDDFYGTLRLDEVQTLAAIERWRPSSNTMVAHFIKVPLGRQAIERILKYSEFGEDTRGE